MVADPRASSLPPATWSFSFKCTKPPLGPSFLVGVKVIISLSIRIPTLIAGFANALNDLTPANLSKESVNPLTELGFGIPCTDADKHSNIDLPISPTRSQSTDKTGSVKIQIPSDVRDMLCIYNFPYLRYTRAAFIYSIQSWYGYYAHTDTSNTSIIYTLRQYVLLCKGSTMRHSKSEPAARNFVCEDFATSPSMPIEVGEFINTYNKCSA